MNDDLEIRVRDLERHVLWLTDQLRASGVVHLHGPEGAPVFDPHARQVASPLDTSGVGVAPGHHHGSHETPRPLDDEGRQVGIAQPPLRKDVIGG
jgi:hypothetical protein